MFTGFEKIVEERIKAAQRRGDFNHLPGAGRPLDLDDDRMVPDDLRLAYKMLKNADCLPPEVEMAREIRQTETLLAGIADAAERYRVIKRLNFLIMKLNMTRGSAVALDMPQRYAHQVMVRLDPTAE